MSKNTWNHRVVVTTELIDCKPYTYYAIHEVHYEGGKPVGVTKYPVAASGDDVEGLRWELTRMLEALDKPALKYEDF